MKKSILFLSLWIMQAWALSCSAPVTLSEPGGIYLAPKATLNEKGEALVAWQALAPGETFFVQATTRDAEKKWSEAESLGDFEERICYPQLCMTSEGKALVGWECRRGEEVFYKFSKKAQGSWCPAITVASSDDFKKIIAAEFDSEGNPVVLGIRIHNVQEPQISGIHYHHALAKKNYKTFSTLSEIIPFQINRSPQGQMAVLQVAPHKTWYFRTSDYDVQQLKLKEEGNWAAPTTTCQLGLTNIESVDYLVSSTNSKEKTALIWVDRNDKPAGMRVVVSPESSEASPVVLATSKTGFYNPKILVDEQDNILAAWVGRLEDRAVIFAAYKPQGQPWTSPMPLSHSKKHADKFELSHDHQGHFLVVWCEGSLKFEHVIYGAAFSTQTQEWSLALLSPEGQVCGDPSIAFNEKGEGIITWLNNLWEQKQCIIQAAELKIDE
jgi:hypothetical protein